MSVTSFSSPLSPPPLPTVGMRWWRSNSFPTYTPCPCDKAACLKRIHLKGVTCSQCQEALTIFQCQEALTIFQCQEALTIFQCQEALTIFRAATLHRECRWGARSAKRRKCSVTKTTMNCRRQCPTSPMSAVESTYCGVLVVCCWR